MSLPELPPLLKRTLVQVRGVFSHRCLRKASAANTVIIGLEGSAGIAALPSVVLMNTDRKPGSGSGMTFKGIRSEIAMGLFVITLGPWQLPNISPDPQGQGSFGSILAICNLMIHG
jgi:hypothetical protein